MISEEIFSQGSKCNNKEYTVLEASAGRKIISNKNEAKQFKNGKHLTLNLLQPTRDSKLCKNITCTQNSNGPPYRTSPFYKPTQFLPECLAIRDTQTNTFRRW